MKTIELFKTSIFRIENKINHKINMKEFILKNLNIFLLLSILGMFFLSPFLETISGRLYSRTIFFTIIFLSSVVAVKTNTKRLLYIALLLSVYIWTELLFFNVGNKYEISFFVTIIYFIYILVILIIQLIKSKVIDVEIIMESINIYLLIGLVGAIILNLTNQFIPGSINAIPLETSQFHEYLYFSFVTLTTLGYGDISPTLPFAKSVIVILAIIGQFYFAIIMAFLISKMFSQNTTNQNNSIDKE